MPYPLPSNPVNQTPPTIPSRRELESTFIDTLVKACSCRQTTRTTQSSRSSNPMPFSIYHRARRRELHTLQRPLSRAIGIHLDSGSRSKYVSVSRDDYRQMLDYYREPSDTPARFDVHGPIPSALPVVSPQSDIRQGDGEGSSGSTTSVERDLEPPDLPANRIVHSSEVASSSQGQPGVTLGDNSEELHESSAAKPILPLEPQSEGVSPIERLQRLLADQDSPHDQIYEAYCQLPQPGVKYMDFGDRRLLFHRLSVIERKNRAAMLRFLHLVDDMKEASIPLLRVEWNSAIAYAGRCFVHVEAPQVESALRIWKEMEQEAGVQSGGVTFNILFDIATKAEKFVLAEMILKEMGIRGLEYNRFSYVSLIHYHGLKGNGAGVRKTYRDLVEAGQIVDTSVMNCVIASLIRAGEPSAAEQVYERMKRLLHQKTGQSVPASDWRFARDLGRGLNRASRKLRDKPNKLEKEQAKQCLSPDLRTFTILIDYHIKVTGELRPVTVLLHEMNYLSIPMHGRIFRRVFQGFAYHGGVKYTSWTGEKLEAVWTSLLTALDERVKGVDVQKWMVIWIVRAFAKCSGRARALQIWEEVRNRWKLTDDYENRAVHHLLRNVLEDIEDSRHT